MSFLLKERGKNGLIFKKNKMKEGYFSNFKTI